MMLDGVITAFASLFVQIVFTAGIVGLFGMFISFCNRCFYDCLGDTAFFIMRCVGIIGTPVHEFSHALMCLLFGHRITKVQIYNFKKRTKTLGFVEHTYSRRNPYHQMGNFFIGIAPIVVGGLVVTLLVRILAPWMYNGMMSEISDVMTATGTDILVEIPKSIASIFISSFSFSNFSSWRWWLCIALAFSISIHMEISRSDIKGGLKGLAVISVMLLVLDLVLALLFEQALSAVTSAFVSAGLYLAMFLMIPAIFSGIVILISGAVYLLRELGKSIENSRG
jgi:hypothetical protein